MKHIDDTRAGMSLYITSDSSTTGTVSIPGQNWSTNFTVTANKITVVNVDVPKAYFSCSDCIASKAVKVTSNKDVVVYAHHYQGARSDATLVLPTRTLGKEYYIMTYQEAVGTGRSQFIVVANNDNTKVNINPTAAISKNFGGTRPAGSTYQITLNTGQIYQGIASSSTGDLTGTHIEVIDTGASASCQKVAVFSGSSFTRITNGCSLGGTADNLTEQLYPTISWGNRFILVPALGRVSDNFRFIAKDDNTRIIIYKKSGPPTIANLNSGEKFDVLSEDEVRYAFANNPILVAQFQKTAGCDGGGNIIGDPSMTILNPIEQTLKEVTLYSSEFFNIDNHYLNIVIPTYAASSFRVDGQLATFTPVPRYAQYSYARITVNKGTHNLKADAGFIATAYGEGRVESYGYAAGANVKDLTAIAKVTNSAQSVETSGCLGQPMKFEGSAEYPVVKWEWDFGDGNTDTLQNPTHIYLDTGTYIVKMYTYKSLFDGCSNFDSSEVELTIYDNPTAKMGWTSLCDAAATTFIDSSSIPVGEEYSFTKWTIGEDIVGGKIAQYTFDTTGKIPISMEVATLKLCRDTITDTLTINPKPIAFFSSDEVCFYDSSYFVNESSVISGTIDSFFWNFPADSNTYFNEDQNYFFLDSGYHKAELKVKTAKGCFATFDTVVYKHPRLDVSFFHKDTCIGLESDFINTTVLDGGIFTDTTWYIGVNDTLYTYDASKTFNTPGTYNVYLTMQQNELCSDTFKQVVQANPIPTPRFKVDNTCFGDLTQFTDLSSIYSGSINITWDLDDGLSRQGVATSVNYSAGGIKTIKLTTTSDQGCTADTIKDVVITYPSINSIIINDLCKDESQSVSSTNDLGLDSFVSYTWEINNLQVSSDSVFSHIGTQIGKNIVKLSVKTKNTCEISLFDSFQVYALPQADFLISPVCLGDKLKPISTATIVSPEDIDTHKWIFDDVEVSTDKNLIIPTKVVGSISLKLVVESTNGCTDEITKLAVVNLNPASSFTARNFCDGDFTEFSSTSTLSSGFISSTIWTLESSELAGTTVEKQFQGVGEYDIKLITESNNSCRDTILQSIIIHPLPQLNVDLEDYNDCTPFTPVILNSSSISSGSILNYQWYWGDGNISQDDNPSYTYSQPGLYSIKVKATSDKGCNDSLLLVNQVEVYPLPRVDFSYSPKESNTLTEFITFKDSSDSDVTQWDWSTNDGGIYSGREVRHTFTDSGAFQVTLLVADDNGCINEAVKDIYVNADLFIHIPNSFSPNGDRLNNTYGLGGLTQGVVDLNFKIYNKWGEQIFESTNVDDRWDGNYKGKRAQQGVYVYVISFTDPKRSQWYHYKGEVHLIR